jgi:hypothetical protein
MTRRVKPPVETQGYPLPLSFVVPGRLYTKANHRTLFVAGGHARMAPAMLWQRWTDCDFAFAAYRACGRGFAFGAFATGRPNKRGKSQTCPMFCPPLLDEPVHVLALYYPPDRVGLPDTDGMHKAVGDALQRCGVLRNDVKIKHWDGSRIMDPDPAGVGFLSVTVHRYLGEERA